MFVQSKSGSTFFLLGLSLVYASGTQFIPLEQARRLSLLSSSASETRIVGGSAADANQFPFQVALLRYGISLSCGGSLIANQWVLTAAHCVYSGNQVASPFSITVLAGTVNLGQGGVRRQVQRIIPHENYGNFRNDIALLRLTRPYQLGRAIQPIALGRSDVPTGGTVTISGWGRLYSNGPLPALLQYNRVVAMSARECVSQTGIRSGLLCLRSPANNGACNGDSGGPAVYNDQLVGVANFVINYCGSSAPDGYAKVSDFVQWIQSKIN
ncbi:serine protease SP24D-like [Topomyia yanbarensis]|uniref:serine protease SP24D-like n=1 Tax=Topomyia yanbarensis TaxID=2498891 RepID=UPI00273AAC15|nr:serine protease SP24D-like [Topomyia yanbarensis]